MKPAHPMPEGYLEVSQAVGAALFSRQIEGPIMMLNLLRFREVADYSQSPELTPSAPISGAAAFDQYIDHTLPFLEQSGGELVLTMKSCCLAQ